MAIFNMEDSSINEYINEHGGAHRKYTKIASKTTSKNIEKSVNTLANSTSPYISNKEKEKFSDKSIEQMIDARKNADLKNKLETYTKNRDQKSGKRVKDDFKKLFGGPGSGKVESSKSDFPTDEIVKHNKKEIKAKLKAKGKLREAAEYILSILDEMDYIEED